MKEDLFLHMEDFDNAELSDYDHDEQLREAVISYNEEHGTAHDPTEALHHYKAWRFQKNWGSL